MAATKTDGGREYPAEAYLYVPDPDKPSTWKIRIWESPETRVTRAQLGRAAAALTTGFRGNVVDLPRAERVRLARKLVKLYREHGVNDEEIPPDLRSLAGLSLSSEDLVTIDATLFKAGEYPDKGVRVGEEDLEGWIRSFQQGEGIPILIEHKWESPIRVGWVNRLWREGEKLMGQLALFRSAYEWLNQIGVRALSVGLEPDLSRIYEVSVVGMPRVREAGFNEGNAESALLEIESPSELTSHIVWEHQNRATSTKEEQILMEQSIQDLQQKLAQLEQELRARDESIKEERRRREMLEFALHRREVEHRVDALVRAGKLPPALREHVIGLGMERLQFADSSSEDSSAFTKFMDAIESLPSWGGEYPEPRPDLGRSDEVEFLKKLGYSEEEIRDILESARRK